MQESNFREIFEANKNKVFNISLNMLQNIEDAEDITQEVFAEVFSSFDSFNEKSLISTWIHKITVNKCLDSIKAKKRKKRFAFLTNLFHPETGELLHNISHFDHPETILENKEFSEALFKALEKLPLSQMTAFVLLKIEGFTQKETATTMQLTEKAVEGLFQRAKENLRKVLGNFYNERRIH